MKRGLILAVFFVVLVLALVSIAGAPAHAADLCGMTTPVCVSASTQLRRLSTADTGNETRWVTLQIWTPWSIGIDPAGAQVTLKSQWGGANMLDDGATPGATGPTTTGGHVNGCSGSVSSGKVVLHAASGDVTLGFAGASLVMVSDPAQKAVLKQNWSGMNVADSAFVLMRTVASVEKGGKAGQSQPIAWDVKGVSRACGAGMTAPGSTNTTAGSPPESRENAKQLRREAETKALEEAKELGRVVGQMATKSIEDAGKDMDELRFESSDSKQKVSALDRSEQSTDLDADESLSVVGEPDLAACLARMPPEYIPEIGDGFGPAEGQLQAAIRAADSCQGPWSTCVSEVRGQVDSAARGASFQSWARDVERVNKTCSNLPIGAYSKIPNCPGGGDLNAEKVNQIDFWCWETGGTRDNCAAKLRESLAIVNCAAYYVHACSKAKSAADYAQAKIDHESACKKGP